MPSLCADTKCSTSPSYTRTSVSPPRDTNASICSPGLRLGDDPVGDRPTRSGRDLAVTPRSRRWSAASTRSVGWPSPTGTPWPSLPHVPGLPIAKSLPTHVDVAQHLRAVADQVALAQRLGDLAVLDQVRLGHAEHEVAGGGVDLPTAELGDVHAVLGRADDVVRVVGAVESRTCSSSAPSAGACSSGGDRCPTAAPDRPCASAGSPTCSRSARRPRSARCAASDGPRRRSTSVPHSPAIVPSSTSVTSGEATSSPTLPA